MKEARNILLMSSGLDSFCAWHLLGSDIDPVYFQLGHRYEQKETETLDLLETAVPGLMVRRETRLYLGDLERPDGFIPLRNMLLVAAATLDFDGPCRVHIGALRGEASRDKSVAFFRQMSKALTLLHGERVEVVAPFRRKTKAQVVRQYLASGGNPNWLTMTRSCYTPDVPHDFVGCGRCMACFRRWVAMTMNGIDEAYQEDPAGWEAVVKPDFSGWWRNLRKAYWAEWGNILINNADAYRVLHRL